jgi:hypothetical protein
MTDFNDAAEKIGNIIDPLRPDDKLRLLALACGFSLSLVGAGDRQKARDRLVELIDAESRHAVVARCDA